MNKLKVFKETSDLRFHFISIVLSLILISFAYGHTLHYPFHLDDRLILSDPDLHLTKLTWKGFEPILKGNRPVANITLAFNFSAGALEVAGYHWVNILIHYFTFFAVYMIFLKTLSLVELKAPISMEGGAKKMIAFFGGLLWALHPVQTQAVTYIVQRMASLAALFYLLSLLCYILGRQIRGRRSYLYFTGSFLAAFLAFGTKENTLTLPLIILIYELFFISEFHIDFFRKEVRLLAVMAIVLILGLSWITGIYQSSLKSFPSLLSAQYGVGEMDPFLRVMTEWRVMVLYLTLLIYPDPARMNFDYDFPMSVSLFQPVTTFFSLLVILLMIGFAVWNRKKHPLFSFSILWFFINLIIESTVLKLDLVFEHRLYLPSVMLFLPFSIAIYSLGARYFRKQNQVLIGFGILFLSLIAFLAHERNKVWKTEISLWSDVLAKSPNKLRVLSNAGDAYLREGDFKTAMKLYYEYLARDPNSGTVHNDLGIAYQASGNIERAILEYQEAARLDPSMIDSRQNLGSIFLVMGRNDLAVMEFKRIVELNPNHSRAHTNLGILYDKMGNRSEALREFEEGVRNDPQSSFSHFNYAYFLESTGKRNEAIEHYEEALRWVSMQGELSKEIILQRLKGLRVSSG